MDTGPAISSNSGFFKAYKFLADCVRLTKETQGTLLINTSGIVLSPQPLVLAGTFLTIYLFSACTS